MADRHIPPPVNLRDGNASSGSSAPNSANTQSSSSHPSTPGRHQNPSDGSTMTTIKKPPISERGGPTPTPAVAPAVAPAPAPSETAEKAPEHLNIKVSDGTNEVFFRIKQSTELSKLMDAFCDRQGKNRETCRFLFDGQRLVGTDKPCDLELSDGDCIECFVEQIGGRA